MCLSGSVSPPLSLCLSVSVTFVCLSVSPRPLCVSVALFLDVSLTVSLALPLSPFPPPLSFPNSSSFHEKHPVSGHTIYEYDESSLEMTSCSVGFVFKQTTTRATNSVLYVVSGCKGTRTNTWCIYKSMTSEYDFKNLLVRKTGSFP